MTEIAAFLLARVGEDEAAARGELGDGSSQQSGGWSAERVLAECAAKRLVIELLDTAVEVGRRAVGTDEYVRYAAAELTARAALLRLAEPHAGHAEYREEWRLDDTPRAGSTA